VIAAVPMVSDAPSALALAHFPGLDLPHGFATAIVEAEDPTRVGIEACARLTAQLRRAGCFRGINLSGSAAGGDPDRRLQATMTFVAAARDAWAAG
jgi:hypothetical protein